MGAVIETDQPLRIRKDSQRQFSNSIQLKYEPNLQKRILRQNSEELEVSHKQIDELKEFVKHHNKEEL